MGADFSYLKVKAIKGQTIDSFYESIASCLNKEGYIQVESEEESSYSFVLSDDGGGFFHYSDLGNFEQKSAEELSKMSSGLVRLDINDEAQLYIRLYLRGELQDAYRTSKRGYDLSKDKESYDYSEHQINLEKWQDLMPGSHMEGLTTFLPNSITYQRPKDYLENLLHYDNIVTNLYSFFGWQFSLKKLAYRYEVEGLPGSGLYFAPDDDILYGHFKREADEFLLSNYFNDDY